MKYYDLNTSSVVDSRKIGYISMPAGGVRPFSDCTDAQKIAAGFLRYLVDAIPNHYAPGAPFLVREGDTMRCTWPNAVLDPAPWRAQLTQAIQAKKVQKRDGGFLIDGTLFDSDAGANVAYLNFYTRISVDPMYSTPWKASGNVWVVMNAALFALVSAGFQANTEAAFGWQAQMDAALAEAPDTLEALSAVEALINT